VPWAIGAVAVFLLLIVAAISAAFAGYGHEVLLYGVIFAVMIPVSTGILILSMIISSSIAGGIEFGEVHVVIPKAIGLLLLVNIVQIIIPSLFGVPGYYTRLIALPVWLFGLMLLFHLDLWEARFLIFVNWFFNYVSTWLVVLIVIAAMSHMADDGSGGAPTGSTAKANDKLARKLLRDDLAIEIREWHKKTDLQLQKPLADKAYDAGAKKVSIVTRMNRDNGRHEPFAMIIELPSDPASRKTIFTLRKDEVKRQARQERLAHGIPLEPGKDDAEDDPVTDEGQNYLIIEFVSLGLWWHEG
jgi:hypothetical protein